MTLHNIACARWRARKAMKIKDPYGNMPSETTLDRPTDRPLEQQTIESDEPDLFDAPKPVPAPITANLPVPVGRPRRGRRLRLAIGLLLILIAGGTGGFYWWKSVQSQLPAGIFWGNGRIEADHSTLPPKFAGRIAELSADQGDMVKAGQIVARMDTRDLEASLRKAQAQVELSHRAIDEANANAVQLNSQVLLAQQEFDRLRRRACSERLSNEGNLGSAPATTGWRPGGAACRAGAGNPSRARA